MESQQPAPKRGRGPSSTSAATQVRQRVLRRKEGYWMLSDFPDLPAGAVAHGLSRLAREGVLQRVRKGLYYRSTMTIVGPSVPSSNFILEKTMQAPLHPAGLTASSHLGFTTQNPLRGEFSTPAASAPSTLKNAVVHTRRPPVRHKLEFLDGALLEFLRERAFYSDLPPAQTVKRLTSMVEDPQRFKILTRAALEDPPRVRAILGALGELANAPSNELTKLRASLNPLSKFDFGALSCLPNAREWQAK